jgi:transposase
LHLSRGKSVKYISNLLGVGCNTIYAWLSRWDKIGLVGLMILPGRGVKSPMDTLLKASNAASVELITLIKKN